MEDRRDFLKATGAAALSTSLFTGKLRGANDKVQVAFIGMGKMGRSNLRFAMKQDNVAVHSVCDIYDRNLNWAGEIAGPDSKKIRDFREILADKSVDAVCISTPDHWHAYQTVEACKAGKDVYVEKPISVTIEEGQKMVQATRKYNRVVQAGTMQRSAGHFQEACNIVRRGDLGKVTFVRTWNWGLSPEEGIGNPEDAEPPAGLDWDMWLGPAPKRQFNNNRFGVDPDDRWFSHFRWFWDYAGGMMTDWGVHWLDIVQMAFDETMPTAITSLGGKLYVKDNRETPDTIQVTYEYPGFIATYEHRMGNSESMFGQSGGILFHGDKGTLFVNRSFYKVVPQPRSTLEPTEVKSTSGGNSAHWANFIDCIRTRQKPISDIETCARSSATCILGNVALRSKLRLDWDLARWTVQQNDARKYLSREARKPWKIVV